jgi:tetratricopeptide (TPR) repeat protein
METKQKVENLLKTAKLYHGQGLLTEAQKAYQGAYDLINSSDQVKNKETLLSEITDKIEKLQTDAKHVESAPRTHELSEDVQNLIKNLFSFSEKKDPNTKALTEAVTLAKFGQTERAIDELTLLLDHKSVRVVAAKNILRCYMLMSAYDRAMAAYEKWASEERFLPNELESIRILLEHQLNKKGIEIQKPLPEVTVLAPQNALLNGSGDAKPQEVLDIGSVLVNFDQGPLKGKPIEFDVNFQTGNTVSLLIESKEKKLLDTLNVGFRLRDVQFRSTVAIFRGAGVVSAKIKIHEGPKKGDYLMDIKVQDN